LTRATAPVARLNQSVTTGVLSVFEPAAHNVAKANVEDFGGSSRSVRQVKP